MNTRRFAAIVAVALLSATAAQACSVCVGNPEAPMSRGMQVGIAVMIGVTTLVLAAFATFFVGLARRARLAGPLGEHRA